jgi:two-component system, response regulator YesN
MRNFKILLVDNDKNERIIKKLQFGNVGVCIDVVASVSEAKKEIMLHDYDYVITDIMMPIDTGLDLAEYICARYPDLPVVFATAYPEFEKARGKNVIGVIMKPYTPSQFFDIIRPYRMAI